MGMRLRNPLLEVFLRWLFGYSENVERDDARKDWPGWVIILILLVVVGGVGALIWLANS
jgi:hypothetical protein